MSELHESRVIKGLLEAGVGFGRPDAIQGLLNRDIEIVSDPDRTSDEDLWPCIWGLAAALTRQFTGQVYVRCGKALPLAAPAQLGPRCVFVDTPREGTLRIGVGIEADIWGDACGSEVTYGAQCLDRAPAHPSSCFALAGILAYAALGNVVELPRRGEEWITRRISVPLPAAAASFPAEMTFLGLGQLGQAYLALNYFLQKGAPATVHLVDKDILEKENFQTQILLEESVPVGEPKSEHLEHHLRDLGWDARGRNETLTWGSRKANGGLALLGFDNMEARRIAVTRGYDWILEAGLNSDLSNPRATWHSLPSGDRARALFPDRPSREEPSRIEDSDLAQSLIATPGKCGWLTYKSIRASAPALGLLAASFVGAELLHYLVGDGVPIRGTTGLWVPLQPFLRENAW